MAQPWRNIASPSWPDMCSVEQRRSGAHKVLPEQRPALDEGEAAEVIVAGLQEIERVEGRCSGPGAA
jgi:hypothetical protein